MKIGVFGDSYALKAKEGQFKSWIDLLADSYTLVDSHGIEGSPFYLAVKKFEEYYKAYDKCIIVVTNPWRYEIQGEFQKYFLTGSLLGVEQHQSKLDQSTRDWWMLKHYTDWMKTCPKALEIKVESNHANMLDYVKRIKKDVVLIPAFDNSFLTESIDFSLNQVSEFELKSVGHTSEIFSVRDDFRVCHMTEKNNIELYNQVKNILDEKDNKFYLDRFNPMSQQEFFELLKESQA